MTIQKLRLTCESCKHVFDGEIVVDCPIPVAVASMKSVRCPKCSGKKVGLGGDYTDKPPLTAPLEVRVGWWEDQGERGTSSNTIFAAFTGYSPRDVNWPLDPDDFRRCKLLLDLIPEWRADLSPVSRAYPWFAPMIDRWGDIEALFMEESPKGVCPRCYELMKRLEKECHILRYPPHSRSTT